MVALSPEINSKNYNLMFNQLPVTIWREIIIEFTCSLQNSPSQRRFSCRNLEIFHSLTSYLGVRLSIEITWIWICNNLVMIRKRGSSKPLFTFSCHFSIMNSWLSLIRRPWSKRSILIKLRMNQTSFSLPWTTLAKKIWWLISEIKFYLL